MDEVRTLQGVIIYQGQHADVKAWLEDPANANEIGDTTQVLYGDDAPEPWTIVYATEYLANYDETFPNG